MADAEKQGTADAFQRRIDDAVAGESAAFATLYERYAGRVRAFAAARKGHDPEALANDVMLRVFQNLATSNDPLVRVPHP
ncbi:MAG: hypothetical protein AAF567_01250 [Actinomycetota bacterium]